MGTILGLLSGLVSIGLKIWGWFSTRSKQKAGADAQSAKDVAVSEKVEAAELKAAENAPKTKTDAISRLREHTA